MKLSYLINFDNFSAESRKLKRRMNNFLDHYLISPKDVSLIIRQGDIENIVNIYPENKYFKIKGLSPKKDGQGRLLYLNTKKSAVIKIRDVQYQIKFRTKNSSQ